RAPPISPSGCVPGAAQTGEIAARKRLRSDRALRAQLPVDIDDGLAVTAGPGQPLSGETLADLMQAGLQGAARRQDFHPAGGKLLAVPFGLVLRSPPAAHFRGGGNFEQRVLRGLVEPLERRLVDEGDVLREPRLGIVEVG